MTGDLYIQSVVNYVPEGMPLRDQIQMELRSNIAERLEHGEPLDAVLKQLGDPLTLAESYLASVPLASARTFYRICAKLVDMGLCGLVVAAVAALFWLTFPPEQLYMLPILCVFAFVLGFPGYTAFAEYRHGRTIGKRLMGIQVVRESGAGIGVGQALLRQLPYFCQFYFIDALFALFTERRQRAFELLTKTRAVVLLLGMMLAGTSTGWAQTPAIDVGEPLGRLVDIGGRRLHLNCTGSGSPTVILESGASSFAVDWALVQPQVAATNRVCSYDRAGMGWSDAGQPERADRVVRDLHALLAAAEEKPPYVMVGASRGGIFTRIFQRRYPSEVVGLVQVDPGHEGGMYAMLNGQPVTIASLTPEELLASIPPGAPPRQPVRNPQTGAPFDRLPPELYRARVEFERRLIAMVSNVDIPRELVVDVMQGERDSLSELLEFSRANEHPLGDLPLVVLSRGSNEGREQGTLHQSLAAQSSRGRHEFVLGAYHEIHLSHPAVVVAAIREVVAQASLPDKFL